MNSSSENQSFQSAADFAQHLRACAEQAAAASVQHAGLSERYLDLSCQLTALSEKSLGAAAFDLQKAIQAIESAMTDTIPVMPLSATDSGAAGYGIIRGVAQAEAVLPTVDSSGRTAPLSAFSGPDDRASPLCVATGSKGFRPRGKV